MKITLIRPNIGRDEDGAFEDSARMEPLPLAILAALTPPGVEVVCYDDREEAIPYDEPTDLVAISVQIFTARRAYEISEAYRRRKVPVILGGMHTTLMPEEASAHADAIYLGDAEVLWPTVVEDAARGCLKPVYQAHPGIPQAGGVLPQRAVFEGKHYLPLTLLQYGRGCHYACEFCATSVFFDRTHFYRPVEEVIQEIEQQDRRFLFFVDDNIVSDHEAAKELFRALIPLKVHWVSQASIDMTQDLELMDLMVRSGCLGHVVGFESIDPRSLNLMHKAANLTDDFKMYKPQLEILRDHGLQTWAAFTLGHDYDTLDSIQRTVDFAMENKFTFAAFNILMPYPKTKLYEQLKAQGRLLYEGTWWLQPNYRFNHAAFIPKHMTPEALTEACLEARKSFNSFGSIARRAFDFKTNMRSLFRFGIYLTYTPLFRKETFKKQGMWLGKWSRNGVKRVTNGTVDKTVPLNMEGKP